MTESVTRAVLTNKAPCRFVRGDIRRVPDQRRHPVVGYHVCCPRCGFVSMAIHKTEDFTISESSMGRVSFSSPLRCLYCCVLIHMNRNRITLEEDEHVLPVQYR